MSEEDAAFDGVSPSTTTTQSGDSHITWDDGFNPSTTGTYMYGFLSNGSLSGGVWSNSEIEDDKRVTMNSGADSMSLTSSVWYYERGDKMDRLQATVIRPVIFRVQRYALQEMQMEMEILTGMTELLHSEIS